MQIKPLLNQVPSQLVSSRIYLGDGINTFLSPFEIKDSQATYLRNLISTYYPTLKVRDGMPTFASTLTAVKGMGQRNNQYLHVQDGTVWKYWNGSSWANVQTGLTASEVEFEEFSTGTTKYTILANGTNKLAWDGTSITNLTNAPASRIFSVHKGRIYWARENDIVFCATNLINDYTTVSGGGTIDITRAKGAITAMYPYNDKMCVFTAFSMHELHGIPSLIPTVIDIEGDIGCVSDKSLIKCSKRLYWMWYDGIYEYNGASIIKVSEATLNSGVRGGVTSYIRGINQTYLTSIVSGAKGDYLYTSIPYGAVTVNNLTLVFDTNKRLWFVYDKGFYDFTTIGNNLYGVDSSGVFWKLDDGATTTDNGTAISWSWISKCFSGGANQKESVNKLWAIIDLPVGSTLSISYSDDVDSSTFTSLYTFTASADEQNIPIQIPVNKFQNLDWYRLKFEGTGPCTIHYIGKRMRVKS